MELDLGRCLAPASCSSTAVAMVRERATAAPHRDRRSTSPPSSATCRADELKLKQVDPQPAHERREVHARRRLGRPSRRGIVGDGGARDRPRHGHRHRRGRRRRASSRRSSAAAARPATSTEGTGLGLTLSKRIVDLHGGRLWMTSRLGVREHVRVRDADARAGAPAEPLADAAAGSVGDRTRHGTVLIVEDDPQSADLLRRLPRGRRRTTSRSPATGSRGSSSRGGCDRRRGHPRHPAAAARRLGSARAPEGRPRDRRRARW